MTAFPRKTGKAFCTCMNIDRGITDRALAKAGQEPLSDTDIENESTVWRLIKAFYLPTILETLANTEWTSQTRRARMEAAEEEENLTRYAYVYLLPEDCAKPVEIPGRRDFMTEGRLLYTDEPDACLIYVSDGRTSPYVRGYPDEEGFAEKEYYTKDPETGDFVPAEVFDPDAEYWCISGDDYPGYREFRPDAILSEYIETRLAAKIALKITGDKQLYSMLIQESMIAENKAVKASVAHSRAKERAHPWWADQIGLGEGL